MVRPLREFSCILLSDYAASTDTVPGRGVARQGDEETAEKTGCLEVHEEKWHQSSGVYEKEKVERGPTRGIRQSSIGPGLR